MTEKLVPFFDDVVATEVFVFLYFIFILLLLLMNILGFFSNGTIPSLSKYYRCGGIFYYFFLPSLIVLLFS